MVASWLQSREREATAGREHLGRAGGAQQLVLSHDLVIKTVYAKQQLVLHHLLEPGLWGAIS